MYFIFFRFYIGLKHNTKIFTVKVLRSKIKIRCYYLEYKLNYN